MTSIQPSPLPVVLSLETGVPSSQYGIHSSTDTVITIAISRTADRTNEHPTWDELIGNR